MRSAWPLVVPLLAVVVMPALVAVRLGGDAGVVFGVAWLVAVPLGAAGTAVVWRSVRSADDSARVALERALTLVVPVVVVVLVGSPWILSAFGRQVRDTGVGTLVLLALSAVPYTAVAVAVRVAAVRGRPAVVPSLVAVAVAVVVTWVPAPVVGVVGAGFGWLLGWSAVAAALVVRKGITRPVDVTPAAAPR